MKKLNVIFLYCMLATASTHGMMIVDVLCKCAAIYYPLKEHVYPHIRVYMETADGNVHPAVIYEGKNLLAWLVVFCSTKSKECLEVITFGKYKSPETKAKAEQDRAEKEKENLRYREYELRTQEALLHLRKECMIEKEAAILEERNRSSKEKEEIQSLRQQLKEFQDRQITQQTIAAVEKKNQKLEQKMNTMPLVQEISIFQKENKKLKNKNEKLKNKNAELKNNIAQLKSISSLTGFSPLPFGDKNSNSSLLTGYGFGYNNGY